MSPLDAAGEALTSDGCAASTMTALRLALLDAGYHPVPVLRHDASAQGAGKRPTLTAWQNVCQTTGEAEIRQWETDSHQRNSTNTGLLCGELLAVDMDILDADLAQSIQKLAEATLPATPLQRTGQAPKTLLVFRAEGEQHKISTPKLTLPNGLTAQIEVLGTGNQFVAFGIHPGTRRQYVWRGKTPPEVPFAELPVLTEQALRAFLEAAEGLIRAAGGRTPGEPAAPASKPASASAGDLASKPRSVYPPATRADIESALAAVANCHDWQDWHKMGAAIYDGLGDDGEELFVNWSAQSPKYDAAATRKKWASYRTSRSTVTVATLFYQAQQNGWRGRADGPGRSDFSWLGTRDEGAAEGAAMAQPAEPASPPSNSTWAQPLDFLSDQNSEPPTLLAEHIPEALAPFVFDVAERMGVDPATVALSCIVACASVISDDWRVQPKRYDPTWNECPRLWGAIVGDPSILKSPVIAAATKPIERLETEAHKRHAEAMLSYNQKVQAAKKDKTNTIQVPPHPRRDRYLVEGATVEALSEVLRDDAEARQRAPAGKVLSRQDEMSEFFGNLDRYKTGGNGGGDRGAYLRLYNGGKYSIDRVMRGAFMVPNWSACFLGGIQPGPIQRIAKDSAEDGLLQRFLYVVPGPQKPGADRAPVAGAIERYNALFPALAAMRPNRLLYDPRGQVVALHEGAQRHRKDVETAALAMAAMPDVSPRLKAALGKWPGMYARIALTFHVIELADARACGKDSPYPALITERTAERAAAFMLDIVMPHLLRADAVMFDTPQLGHCKWIAGYILAHNIDRIAARDVIRNYRALAGPERRQELLSAMENLVTIGWLEPDMPGNPRRTVTTWLVNPTVHKLFRDEADSDRARREQSKQDIAAAAETKRRRKAGGGSAMR